MIDFADSFKPYKSLLDAILYTLFYLFSPFIGLLIILACLVFIPIAILLPFVINADPMGLLAVGIIGIIDGAWCVIVTPVTLLFMMPARLFATLISEPSHFITLVAPLEKEADQLYADSGNMNTPTPFTNLPGYIWNTFIYSPQHNGQMG